METASLQMGPDTTHGGSRPMLRQIGILVPFFPYRTHNSQNLVYQDKVII
jgi:hypothetical protein